MSKHTLKRSILRSIVIPSLVIGGLVTTLTQTGTLDAPAWLIRQPKVIETWSSFSPEEIERGVIIPKDTNVAFHMPLSFTRITREVLLGHKGKDVRYWGYCYPENYDPATIDPKQRIPGKIFLSEKEQLERQKAAEKKPTTSYSVFQLPTKQDLETVATKKVGSIRNQLDSFTPGLLCYIMAEDELSMGLDPDNDRLNDKLEQELATDPEVPDTDADGVLDGVEYLHDYKPTIRDTDADGIIDGIEDKDWDGRIDSGETSALVMDSDKDGLCDGYCRLRIGKRIVYVGEDRNLNGKLDTGADLETDPLKDDTNGDGTSDFQAFAQCLLQSDSPHPEQDC